ncbi:MAG: DNA polymerase III subunit delta' [Lachnospiraceae bacterium]|nr:DNA polymerase III subunit delta' [Lachnospiraceae bacterium]
MTGFSDITGHEQLISYFLRSLDHGNISHAYILSGEEGMGKMTLAKAFARSLLCSTHNGCGSCHSCLMFASGNHPDVIYVQHEKENSIGVDDIREQLIADTEIRPYQGGYKVYIIDEAEKLTPAAQNALLKTIEEPPEYVVVMLLTSHEESFLQTILSRCITLRLRPLHDRTVTDYLMKRYGIEQHQASICAAFARGNLGRAITLADSERFMEMHGKTIEILKSIYDTPLYQLLDELKGLKDEIYEVLDTMKLWYRDVVVFKATQDSNLLIFKEEQQTIKKMADHSSYNGLDEIQSGIDKARARLKANVGFDLVAELLLLTLQEN